MVNYLAHHGVKGQKWGVRRYQNPDGSLIKGTLNGASKISDGYYKLKSGDYVITKGTTMYRYANTDEPVDSSRKYVTIGQRGKEAYGETDMLEILNLDFNKSVSLFEYKADRNLIIAGSKKVEDILDKGSNMTRSEYLKSIGENEKWSTDIDTNLDKLGVHRETDHVTAALFDNQLRTNAKSLVDNCSHQGYDGMIDLMDNTDESMPAIVISHASDSMSMVKKVTYW